MSIPGYLPGAPTPARVVTGIRQLWAAGMSTRRIAAELGVSQSTASRYTRMFAEERRAAAMAPAGEHHGGLRHICIGCWQPFYTGPEGAADLYCPGCSV